jgi:hypothetical protein
LKTLFDQISGTPSKGADFDSDIDSEDIPNQMKKLWWQRFASDTKDRKWLAIWTASTVTLWLGAVMIVLMLNVKFFSLNDSILLMLPGTTTFNVLGLSYIVLSGHFPKGQMSPAY